MASEDARRHPRPREGPSGPVPLRVSYGELPHLTAPVTRLLARGHRVVLDLVPPGKADVALLSALAGLALVARRSAGLLRVRTSGDLQGLLQLTGLEAAVSGGQVRRQPVLDEDLRAEEVVDVRDAAG
jgi:hypothetical protein